CPRFDATCRERRGRAHSAGERRLRPAANFRMINLTDQPIDVAALLRDVQRPAAGAVVLFLGTTRQLTDGRETTSLAYEAYRELARKELDRLRRGAEGRWQLVACGIVHRLGNVPLAEASVAIAVSSPHRAAAFEAGEWLIDALKASVP